MTCCPDYTKIYCADSYFTSNKPMWAGLLAKNGSYCEKPAPPSTPSPEDVYIFAANKDIQIA